MNESRAEKLQRADDLRCSLERGIAPLEAHFDMLSRYRLWLDKNQIEAETTDGWPSEHAYDEKNIAAFLGPFNESIAEAVGTLPQEEVPFSRLKPGMR